MPEFFGYTNTIFGTQSTINGAAHNYGFAPPNGSTWRYSGPDTYFVVEETDGATNFNGDPTNEQVSPQEQIGGPGEQTVDIGGTPRQIIYDYTFTVTDGTTTWSVAVIDVDLNNDDDLSDAGEDGYFLVFPDGMPPADTDLTAGPISDNSDFIPHATLGGSVVCFADGTLIETETGPRPVESLVAGTRVLTRDGGLQPIRWLGRTVVPARGDMAPVVIRKGTFGNSADLVVSPQHALLLSDWRAELFFGEPEVLVRAGALSGHDGVFRRSGGMVAYNHILLDAHHLLRAEGMWAESLYPGDMARQSVNPGARDEIERLFPDLKEYGSLAVPCLRGYEAALLPR